MSAILFTENLIRVLVFWYVWNLVSTARKNRSPLAFTCDEIGFQFFFLPVKFAIAKKLSDAPTQWSWRQTSWLQICSTYFTFTESIETALIYVFDECNLLRFRYKSKKKAFTKASKKWEVDLGKKSIENDFRKMLRYCKVIRVIAHSQVIIKKKKISNLFH